MKAAPHHQALRSATTEGTTGFHPQPGGGEWEGGAPREGPERPRSTYLARGAPVGAEGRPLKVRGGGACRSSALLGRSPQDRKEPPLFPPLPPRSLRPGVRTSEPWCSSALSAAPREKECLRSCPPLPLTDSCTNQWDGGPGGELRPVWFNGCLWLPGEAFSQNTQAIPHSSVHWFNRVLETGPTG